MGKVKKNKPFKIPNFLNKIRIVLLFAKELVRGFFWYMRFKILYGNDAVYCQDSDEYVSSQKYDGCNLQCTFCRTSTNTMRGFKILDKKNNKWYKINKNID